MQLSKQEQRNIQLQQEIDRFNKYYSPVQPLTLDIVNHVEDLFSNQGHSGFSASYCFNYLKRLAKNFSETQIKLANMLTECEDDCQITITKNIMEIHNAIAYLPTDVQLAIINLLRGNPLTPITNEEDEWVEDHFCTDENAPYKMYSHKRCSRVSKYVMPDGIEICTYLYDRSFSDNGGYTFFTTGRFGRRQITFPFEIPDESEEVYIYEVEGKTPFILTDPKTIQQVRENYLRERGK